jgi:archaellum component FlaC
MLSTKIKNFLYIGLFTTFSLFVACSAVGYFIEKHKQIKDIYERVIFLEKEIVHINNECAHMREMIDTLTLSIEEYQKYDIQTMVKQYNNLNLRMKKVENDLNELYVYD